VKFKAIKAWNSLPKSWDYDALTLAAFKKVVFNTLFQKEKTRLFIINFSSLFLTLLLFSLGVGP